ncbi:zonadhesin [Caerostris extrusa]|uniref:Zonadhesin n=1 Tax=Caerostris extrusa TaxID=172846 RepID=A0AAV4M935_CAEEX|nr:zonadhesin [Caerostris extrusa]
MDHKFFVQLFSLATESYCSERGLNFKTWLSDRFYLELNLFAVRSSKWKYVCFYPGARFLFKEGLTFRGNATDFCGEAEEYHTCGPCEVTCENPFNKEPCTTPCHPGCFCKPGLLRGQDNKCVPLQECHLLSCGENQEYLECGPSCPLTCSNFQDSVFCTKQCTKGCFCKPGFVLGPNRTCILPQNCPIGPCRDNEMTADCVNPCNTCVQRGSAFSITAVEDVTVSLAFQELLWVVQSQCPTHEHFVPCVNQCNDCWSRGDCEQSECQPGCDCHPGYFRNDNGDCIPETQCIGAEVACGVNEEYTDCVSPCNDCLKQGNCKYHCEYGCDCKKGYFRDSKGICIPAEQCSTAGVESRNCYNCRHTCSNDEQYYICMPTCKTTCANLNDTTVLCSADCRSGCFCKQGLVRGKDGNCIKPSECSIECDNAEMYSSCGPACQVSCANFGKPIMCTHQCVKGCFCKGGLIRGPRGKCIKPEFCPAVNAVQHAPLRVRTRHQLAIENVFGVVFCKPGFVRGPNGKCISSAFCPTVCGLNEEFLACGPDCPLFCTNYTNPQFPETGQRKCVSGCFCKPAFVRGPNGSCIPPTSCPSVCGENEEHQECGTACPASCTNHTTPPTLPKSVCEGVQRKEEYMDCGPPCPSTCENVGQFPCAVPCLKGCFCKPGLVRGPDSKCIPPALCPVVCGENEQFRDCGTACPSPEFHYENEEFKECGSSCPITCDNLAHPPTTCSLPCTRGCFCKPGFVRGPDGKCCLPSSCPIVCGANEEFKDCGSGCPATCSNSTTQRLCPSTCVKGCFCRKGFVRGPTGKCIVPQSCPVMCPLNEVFQECGSACQYTCEDLGKAASACRLPCVRGCFCKPGHVRDREGRCILAHFCPVVCGKNEVFKDCGSACPARCSDRLQPVVCPAVCVRGCFCRDGFVRDPAGTCVPPELCPVVCKENEVFDRCASSCQPTCETLSRPSNVPCNFKCVQGCICKFGYVRDQFGNCILPSFCPIGKKHLLLR